MIEWLNQNQGFIMSLLTLVYVIATLIIVVYNRKVIDEMKQNREEDSRPYIFVYMHKNPRDNTFSLVVKNYGKSGARIEKINIEPKLKFVAKPMEDDFMKNVVLAPNQMVHFMLGERAVETYKKDYIAQVSYKSVTLENKKHYDERYEMITEYASSMGYAHYESSKDKSENALIRIAAELDSIKNNLL